jgi:hypothetical protein
MVRALLSKIFPALSPPASRRDELESLLAVPSADMASFDPHEEALLRNILGLQDLNASDVMIPRADIVSVSMAESFSEIIAQMTAAESQPASGAAREPSMILPASSISRMCLRIFMLARHPISERCCDRRCSWHRPIRLLDLLHEMRLRRPASGAGGR